MGELEIFIGYHLKSLSMMIFLKYIFLSWKVVAPSHKSGKRNLVELIFKVERKTGNGPVTQAKCNSLLRDG